MKEIIREIGWPTISKVGEGGANGVWLLVQHADHDVDFQQKCLDLMLKEPATEVSKKNLAYLQDRILIHRNKPQRYGTQYNVVGSKRTLLPTEDREHLAKRRKSMGLN